MKRILVFSFFPAFVPPSNGGESRLFHFYRALSRHHQVTLLSSGYRDVAEERVVHGANFLERRIPKDDAFASKWAELAPFAAEADTSGPCIAAAGRCATLLHQAYLEEYERADIIIHDSPFTVDYDLFAGLDGKPRLYNAYNCETDLYRALHPEVKSAPLHQLVEDAERRLLERVDCVLYCNESDLASFECIAPGQRYETLFAPNGMLALAQMGATVQTDAARRPHALFMGSAHAPNVKAALFIAKELARQLPEVIFDIVGSCLPEGNYPSNVVRHGLVSPGEKGELLRRADVALNPMTEGSGSNVKVFDYFAHGLPVLSTEVGMRGVDAVDGIHYLSLELEAFPEVLGQWAQHYERLALIAAAGRQLAVERYTWDAITLPVARYCSEAASAANAESRPVLVLNDYNSFTAIGGGATRTRGLYAAVTDWAPVVFLCFSDNGELSVDRVRERIVVVSIPKTAKHQAELSRLNSLSPVAVDDVVAGIQAVENRLLLQVYAVLKENARAIVVEHPYLAAVPALFADRFVYSSQNNEAILKKRLFEPHPTVRHLAATVEMIERRAVERAAAVIAVSSEDAASLTRGVSTAGPLVVVRNGADTPHAPESDDLQAVHAHIWPRSAVFLGSAHPPNTEAANFILRHLAPKLPDVQFNIVGSVCSSISASTRSNVKLWGVLDDSRKAAVMQACSLAVNPMSSGSGSNVKLADFLGNGLYTVTTEFGRRGYPEVIVDHISVAALDHFVEAIRAAFVRVQGESPETARSLRRQLFASHLSMRALAGDFVDMLKGMEVRRKRLLFVTYRYTWPALGGAEAMLEQLLRALDGTGLFDIDVVAARVSALSNRARFAESYRFDEQTEAPVGLRHTRFARFPVDGGDTRCAAAALSQAWHVQPLFEQQVYRELADSQHMHGLAWGWTAAEGGGEDVTRWACSSAGIHLARAGSVLVKGFAPLDVAVLVQDAAGALLFNGTLSGRFELRFDADKGAVELLSSVRIADPDDPRGLAFVLQKLEVDDEAIDLRARMLSDTAAMDPSRGFEILDRAALASRCALDVRLTDSRGPWSSSLEGFLEQNVGKYDLVVTHNNVFRPAIAAIEQAKRLGVPSILIPHAHLDDDFYHFPDLRQSVLDASLVLAAPRAACDFFRHIGGNVRYLPAGIETNELFGESDVAAFRTLHADSSPFVLVLGRKAGAKGYRQIIDAVSGIAGLRVVLIGPDDDGLEITAACATYLGRQPREVVRGALLSCVALVNMSTSESFGIVLLEAWRAGKPVVANRQCAAFHDMAVNDVNALLVDDATLKAALERLVADPQLCARLANEGGKVVEQYDWAQVGERFAKACVELVGLPEASQPAAQAGG